MADPLYELLAPSLDDTDSPLSQKDPQVSNYLTRISTLPFADLNNNEPASLLQSAQSNLRNIQALSKRSHRAVITSTTHLSNVSSLLPSFESQTQTLSQELPGLESAASEFAHKYDRSTENAVLDRRKRAGLLFRNVDRVSDVLDLPSLLSSTISAAQAGAAGATTAASSTTSYATALDIHAHISRLRALYPQSALVNSISLQAGVEVQNLATILIASLQSPSLKLAAAMRTIGLLRRVAPELADDSLQVPMSSKLSTKPLSLSPNALNKEGALGSLFLICRLRTLHQTLEALDPLRELADQETAQRQGKTDDSVQKSTSQSTSALGSQSERFLKRYVEIFREHSFAILSMYKSIFPGNLPEAELSHNEGVNATHNPLLPLPSSVSTFALHLVEMLEDTLREYLPNIAEKSARESLLTQVLYCAGSLGRLGADFSMMVAILEDEVVEQQGGSETILSDEENEPEWIQVMKKHRVQASRLEVLARGVGTQKKTGTEGPAHSTISPTPSPLPA